GFFASAMLFLGCNTLYQVSEDYFLAKALEENPLKINHSLFSANINDFSTLNDNNFKIGECQIETIKAKSYLSLLVNKQGKSKILFQKESALKLPIASLTKLLSALVVEEFYSQAEKIKISSQAVSQLETTGNLRAGEWLSEEELLKIMLIESSNDATFALSEQFTESGFVGLMNLKAKDLDMKNSIFFNPIGLDPEDVKMPQNKINLATANDLKLLLKYMIFEKPEILEITAQRALPLYLENGSFHHTLQSTNQLLGENPYIIGGKTGLTERALGCLAIVLKTNQPDEYIINVLLGSLNRFSEMEMLNTCSLKQAANL
ncbi:MAG: serine hydrolase, partial [bacterium]|nr:serine hydrolase [bacterium]